MPNSHEISESLAKAYKQLLESSKEFLDVTKKEATPAVLDAIDKGKEKVSELSELTAEEIDKVSDFVMRDLEHAAEYIAVGERELGDWLRIDALMIEDSLMEAFSLMVDHTQVALDELAENAKLASEWHSGEIAGIGTLICTQCGETLHFNKPQPIPPCPKCHATAYHRPGD